MVAREEGFEVTEARVKAVDVTWKTGFTQAFTDVIHFHSEPKQWIIERDGSRAVIPHRGVRFIIITLE